jgi:hypothetical protein
LGTKLQAGPSSARDLTTRAAPATARSAPDDASNNAAEPVEVPENPRSKATYTPKAVKLATSGERSLPRWRTNLRLRG